MSEAPKVSSKPHEAAFRRKTWLLLYLPIAVAALALASYGFIWMRGAEIMRASVGDWAQDQRENGLVVSYAAISSGGFPFFLRAHVEDVEIADPGTWRVQFEALEIDALPYAADRLIFSPKGALRFESPETGAWQAAADDIRASIASSSEYGWLFSLEISNGAANSETGMEQISARRFLLDAAPNPADPGITEASIRAEDVAYENDPHAAALSLVDAAFGIALGDGVLGRRPGALTIRRFGLETGTTRLSAAGTLHLDAGGFPAGSIDAEIENPAGIADLLGGAGALSQSEAEAVGTGLALAALPAGGRLAAPILFRDGEATIARIKLADLPRIR